MKNITSTMLALAAVDLPAETRNAVIGIAECIEKCGGQIAIKIQGSISLVDETKILVGRDRLRIGTHTLLYAEMKLAGVKAAGARDVLFDDIMTSYASIIDHGRGGDNALITICSHNIGRGLIKSAVSEAADVFATAASRPSGSMLLSKNANPECEVLNQAQISITDHGVEFGDNKKIAWEEIRAIDTAEALSIALSNNQMVTISSC